MPGRILLVDDDPITLKWLKAVLEREGYAVSTAGGGREALQCIASDLPDLVVLDLVLPDMDGLDVMRQIRQDPRLREVRVIILSVKDRPEDVVIGLRAGADDYVSKRPGAEVDLLAKIRGLVSRMQPGAPSASRSAAPPAPVQGKILAFCSAKGGTGTTSVCVNTAFALAKLDTHAQVLLMDMVVPVGTVGTSIGYESPDTVAKLVRPAKDKVERALVERYVSPFQRWGFRVLLGAANPQEAATLHGDELVPLFETLRCIYNYVVVDFGRAPSPLSLPVLQMSDEIVIVTAPDVTAVKMTRLMLDYMESVGIPRTRFTLISNRTAGRVWIPEGETERELGLPVERTIPYELEYFTQATNSGVPFMAQFPDHAASMMFMDLARMLRGRARH